MSNLKERAIKFNINLDACSETTKKMLERFNEYADEVLSKRKEAEKFLKGNQFTMVEIAKQMNSSRQYLYRNDVFVLYVNKLSEEIRNKTYNCEENCEEIQNLKATIKAMQTREAEYLILQEKYLQLKESVNNNYLVQKNNELMETIEDLQDEINEIKTKDNKSLKILN